MPDRQLYDEAMLFARVRLKVSDPELKEGQVETYTLNTALGPYERPWGVEGGFAVVYKFRTQSGRLRALRCFRVPMSEDTQTRYEQIGPYFQQHAPTITAGFLYHKDAIQIKEQGKPQAQTFPVIEMDWIEGDTLVDRVNTLCEQRNSAALARLSQEWLNILQTMQQAHIAHGDLAGVNVMVRNDTTLVLIDYDGVYIPPLNGLPQTLLGQADYQHPEVVQRTFDEHMDNFSALVIYTALSALSVQPTLWQRYSKRNAAGKMEDTNLLFTQDDFKHPQQSALLRELKSLKDERVKALAQALTRACQEPVGRVRFPYDLADPTYLSRQALEVLERAVLADNDEEIVAAWVPALDQYRPARKYQERLRLARQRLQVLAHLRTALRQGNLQQITAAYNTLLDGSLSITTDERLMLTFAQDFIHSLQQGDTEALLQIVEDRRYALLLKQVVFTPQEQQTLDAARQQRAALQQLREALQAHDVEAIATSYQAAPQVAQQLGDEERRQVELLVDMTRACNTGDDDALLLIHEQLQFHHYDRIFPLPEQYIRQITQAQHRRSLLKQLRTALQTQRTRAIANAYDAELEHSTLLTSQEQALVTLVRSFVHACDQGDDSALLATSSALQQAPFEHLITFSEQEWEQIAQVQRRRDSLLALQAALHSRSLQQIAAAYDPSMDESTLLSEQERTHIRQAYQLLQGMQDDDDTKLVTLANALNGQDLFDFTQPEQERLALAQQRYAVSASLRRTLALPTSSAEQIADAYIEAIRHTDIRIDAQQQELVNAARSYLLMHTIIQRALQEGDDELVGKAYNAELAKRFEGFSDAELRSINRALLSKKLEDLLKQEQYRKAIDMAQYIQKTTGSELSSDLKFKLRTAIMRFIRQQNLTQLIISIKEQAGGNRAQAQWRWPQDTLVQDGLLVWGPIGSPVAWPPRAQEQYMLRPDFWHIVVWRRNDQARGTCEFPIGPATHIYVQAFAAITDYWDRNRTWRFSDGTDATSYAETAGTPRRP